MDTEERVGAFRAYLKRIDHYNSAVALLHWDKRTYIPRKGVDARSEALGMLASEAHRLTVSDEMKGFLEDLLPLSADLDPITARALEQRKKDFDRSVKIPVERHEEFMVLTSKAEAVWEEARAQSDFSLFAPYLSRIVDMMREFADYWGYERHPYDALLDPYEPGMTVAILDPLFGDFRVRTTELLRRIEAAAPIDSAFLHRRFDPHKQRRFSEYILREMGYDLEAGRLDETAHPFETTIAFGDVRVTTRFVSDFLNSAVFGTIHEGGHALYEQNIADDLRGTLLHRGISMGIHESQSRFWENIVGRSSEFWERYFAPLQEIFPDELGDVDAQRFYRAVNVVGPSHIRVEADELTYNLHIMIRYEIEKGLLQGDIQVRELPGLWREKMREYLGIEPENDTVGVLQDVHWSGGDFGYFPSYALGNMYAAQFTRALERDQPAWREAVRSGRLAEPKEWFVTHVHRHGSMLDPADVLRAATGEELSSSALMEYLTTKYTALYAL